jgi:Flp pilus assembly protein TadD
VYYQKDLTTLAIPSFERAAKAQPENPIFRYHLGLAYAKAGEMIKARPILEAALKLDPSNPQAREAREALAAP